MILITDTTEFLVFERRHIGGAVIAGIFALALIAIFISAADTLALEQTYVMLVAVIFNVIAMFFLGRTERVTLDRQSGALTRDAHALLAWFPLGAITETYPLTPATMAVAQSALEIRHKRADAKAWQVFINGERNGAPWSVRIHKGTSEEKAQKLATKINAWFEN